jgi:hypothetical protein
LSLLAYLLAAAAKETLKKWQLPISQAKAGIWVALPRRVLVTNECIDVSISSLFVSA